MSFYLCDSAQIEIMKEADKLKCLFTNISATKSSNQFSENINTFKMYLFRKD